MPTEKTNPTSRPLAIRIPNHLYAAIQQDAEKDERSMNWKIIKCLERCYGEASAADKPTPKTE